MDKKEIAQKIQNFLAEEMLLQAIREGFCENQSNSYS